MVGGEEDMFVDVALEPRQSCGARTSDGVAFPSQIQVTAEDTHALEFAFTPFLNNSKTLVATPS